MRHTYWVGRRVRQIPSPYGEIKRRLFLGRKVMTNLHSILKSRDITLPTKVRLVKAMVFPVVVYGYKSWIIKEAEHRRIDAFELWCWRRLLRVPWTARRSNQSILKEISPGCSLEGLILKLILWPPDAKSWLIGKDPDAGKDWGQEEKGMTEDEMAGWHHRLNGHGFGWTPGVGDGQGGLACCGSWGCKESDTTEWLNWTKAKYLQVWSWFLSFHLPSVSHVELPGKLHSVRDSGTFGIVQLSSWRSSLRSQHHLYITAAGRGDKAATPAPNIFHLVTSHWPDCSQPASLLHLVTGVGSRHYV